MKRNLNKNIEISQLLDTKTSSKELIMVVRSLLRFIVVESKEYIDENSTEAYVQSYLFTLTKATNGLSNYVDMDKLIEQILIDINNNFDS